MIIINDNFGELLSKILKMILSPRAIYKYYTDDFVETYEAPPPEQSIVWWWIFIWVILAVIWIGLIILGFYLLFKYKDGMTEAYYVSALVFLILSIFPFGPLTLIIAFILIFAGRGSKFNLVKMQ